MKEPCPHCGLPRMCRSYIDGWTRQLLREIRDHDCAAWRFFPIIDPPPILPSDPGRGFPGGEEAMADFWAYIRSES